MKVCRFSDRIGLVVLGSGSPFLRSLQADSWQTWTGTPQLIHHPGQLLLTFYPGPHIYCSKYI